MFEYKLQNIITGRTISYYDCSDCFRERLGCTVHIQGTDDPHIIAAVSKTHSSVVPTNANKTQPFIKSVSTAVEYKIVVVSFPNNSKGYEYYYKYSDFPHAIGDKIKIKTPFSESAEAVICDFRSSLLGKHQATKLIQVVPSGIKHSIIVRYVNHNGLSNNKYEYLVDEKTFNETEPFQFKIIHPNSTLVYTLGYKKYNADETIPGAIPKSFTDPSVDDLKFKLDPEETLTAEICQAIETADTSNLDNCCKAYLALFVIEPKVRNSFAPGCNTTSGLSVSEAVNSWVSLAESERDSIYRLNEEITPIAQITPLYYGGYMGIPSNNNNNNTKGDEKTMNTNKLFKNFEFGKITDKLIKMTMCGLAFMQNDGSYVTYNTTTNELTDVSAFIMEDFDCVFAMPVSIKDIKENDVIKHNNRYVLVKEVDLERNNIHAVDPLAGEEKIIIPTKNMFGFNYYTKIVNLFGGFSATEEMPFGNMLPFFLMREGSSNDALMLAMMMQNNGSSADLMSNPLMMMALMK